MPAPKGNQYAIGNNGGRPPMYDNPEDFAKKAEEYFVYIEGEYQEEVKNEKGETTTPGKWLRHPENATITGLALYMGFCGRDALSDYAKKEEFAFVVKRAKALVEMAYEMRLSGDRPVGAIFALKNMGWADNSSIEHKGDKEKPIHSILEIRTINTGVPVAENEEDVN